MSIRQVLFASAVFAGHTADAQSIDERIAAAPTSTVLMYYAARPDVCGDGLNIQFGDSAENRWIARCEYGPAHVRVTTESGRIVSIRTNVGGERADRTAATDLGEIPAAQAAAWFLDLAANAPGRVAEQAIRAAALADVPDPWRELLSIAKDTEIAADVRAAAVFWVGQSASRAATRELVSIVDTAAESIEVRKAAVFALSQGNEPERGEHLIRIARTHKDADVVAAAFFWLADSPDERAVALFEEVLSFTSD